MIALNINQFWFSLLGSAAILAVVLTTLGLMIGLVKLADIPRKLGTLLGILIALTIVPGILIAAWTRMSLWQQIALAAIGIAILLALRPANKRRSNEKR